VPEESSGIQRAGAITYYLLLRWMAGAESITTSQVATHLDTDYDTVLVLMAELRRLPFIHCAEGYYYASLDLPLWRLCPYVRQAGESCRAAILTYVLVSATMAGEMGLTLAQLRAFLDIGRTALYNMLDHLSAADCCLPIYQDGHLWKIATQHWIVSRKHDLPI